MGHTTGIIVSAILNREGKSIGKYLSCAIDLRNLVNYL